METEHQPRRRRSDNVGWGSIPRLINAERRTRDRAQAQVNEQHGWRRHDDPQHPTSRELEEEGRVEPRH